MTTETPSDPEPLKDDLPDRPSGCCCLYFAGSASNCPFHYPKLQIGIANPDAVRSALRVLVEIRDMPEYDQDDGWRLRDKARKALAALEETK